MFYFVSIILGLLVIYYFIQKKLRRKKGIFNIKENLINKVFIVTGSSSGLIFH